MPLYLQIDWTQEGGGSGKECFCACTIRGKWSGHDSHEGLEYSVIVGFLLIIDLSYW